MTLAATRRTSKFANWCDDKDTIAVDLDGTLCPHEWIDETTIVNPFEGAFNFIANLSSRYNVVIFSARATRPRGKVAILDWLVQHGMNTFVCDVTNEKKYSFLRFVDDRAIVFREPNDYNLILKELGVAY